MEKEDELHVYRWDECVMLCCQTKFKDSTSFPIGQNCAQKIYNFLIKKLPSISMQGLSLLDDIWMKKVEKVQKWMKIELVGKINFGWYVGWGSWELKKRIIDDDGTWVWEDGTFRKV